MKILVTGAAGFIGSRISRELCMAGHEVTGLDSINEYYDPELKFRRLLHICGISMKGVSSRDFIRSSHFPNYRFILMDICDRLRISELFKKEKFDVVCHFAAQPGVRYSIENPFAYTDINISGFLTILEGCRHNNVGRLIYASSSSVYGDQEDIPVPEEAVTDHPLSLYAATKKSNELMAFAYSHLFKFESVGLRFFTVYGPWGRPDMAPWIFTKAVLENSPIKLFNNGNLFRDFTFIDDVASAVSVLVEHNLFNHSSSNPYYSVFNIGNHDSVSIRQFISHIENATGKKALIENYPMQQGDVLITYADVEKLYRVTGYKPSTPAEKGVEEFVKWYLIYHSKGEKGKSLGLKWYEYEKN